MIITRVSSNYHHSAICFLVIVYILFFLDSVIKKFIFPDLDHITFTLVSCININHYIVQIAYTSIWIYISIVRNHYNIEPRSMLFRRNLLNPTICDILVSTLNAKAEPIAHWGFWNSRKDTRWVHSCCKVLHQCTKLLPFLVGRVRVWESQIVRLQYDWL